MFLHHPKGDIVGILTTAHCSLHITPCSHGRQKDIIIVETGFDCAPCIYFLYVTPIFLSYTPRDSFGSNIIHNGSSCQFFSDRNKAARFCSTWILFFKCYETKHLTRCPKKVLRSPASLVHLIYEGPTSDFFMKILTSKSY